MPMEFLDNKNVTQKKIWSLKTILSQKNLVKKKLVQKKFWFKEKF